MKIKLAVLALLVIVFSSSCASVSCPSAHDKSFPPDGRYVLLGPVSCSGETIGIIGIFWASGIQYLDLLEAAKKEYGDADDVVNVSVDNKFFTLFGIFTSIKTNLRGIAIKYVKE